MFTGSDRVALQMTREHVEYPSVTPWYSLRGHRSGDVAEA